VPTQRPSHVYYYEVGAGRWVGSFRFKVTSWHNVRRARIGAKNSLLVAAMSFTQRVFGPSRLTSVVVPRPDEGESGVVDNVVRLTTLGVPLYDLRESYVLATDGVAVHVVAHEHFGPIPWILSRTFEYPAEIAADGLASTYYMPLLGSQWTARYDVGPDRVTLAGTLQCMWAEAHEQARKELTP
jgi:hypothetical protein